MPAPTQGPAHKPAIAKDGPMFHTVGFRETGICIRVKKIHLFEEREKKGLIVAFKDHKSFLLAI